MPAQPSRETCAAVDERDQYRCVRCGRYIDGGSRHHRQLRRGGDHSTANLILLCGSGTTGCHGWVHAHPLKSYEVGLMVHSWHDARDVPVLTVRGWLKLDRSGGEQRLAESEALAIRAELDLLA